MRSRCACTPGEVYQLISVENTIQEGMFCKRTVNREYVFIDYAAFGFGARREYGNVPVLTVQEHTFITDGKGLALFKGAVESKTMACDTEAEKRIVDQAHETALTRMLQEGGLQVA